jgi:hypothetical protein
MNSPMTDSLKVYDILKEAQIPDAQARAITHAIRESDTIIALDVRSVLDERLKEVVTKDVLKADLAELRTELKTDIAELRADMADLKAELMRWMFIFWAGQMAAMIGIVFTAFKLSR